MSGWLVPPLPFGERGWGEGKRAGGIGPQSPFLQPDETILNLFETSPQIVGEGIVREIGRRVPGGERFVVGRQEIQKPLVPGALFLRTHQATPPGIAAYGAFCTAQNDHRGTELTEKLSFRPFLCVLGVSHENRKL